MATTVGDSQTKSGKPGRSTNYTEAEDVALVKAWEGVRHDAGTDNDQGGYWQRIADRFYQFVPEPSARSLRSLRSRYIVIKQSCIRWSGCLEQARNAPLSGCTVDEYAKERYEQMAASKGKPFVFHHCWKLLEHSEKWNGEKSKLMDQEDAHHEKWKLMDQEGPPPKKRRSNSSATDLDAPAADLDTPTADLDAPAADLDAPAVNLDALAAADYDDDEDDDDVDDDDVGVPSLPSSSMMTTIAELMKTSNETTARTLKMTMEFAKKKQQDKMAMWKRIKEKKMALEERRLLLEEKKLRQEIIAEETKLMMMDPSGMDEKARAYWEIRRGEILQSTMRAARMRGGGLASGGGNGGDGDGGANNASDGNGGVA